MPTTYEPIATTTLTSTSANIDFTSIPATYTDLRVVLNALGTASSVYFRVNSDTATNYSRTLITGDGATVTSTRSTSISRIQSPSTIALSTTIPTLITYDIFSYAGSTFKSVLASFSNDKNGSGGVSNLVSMWRSTSAITAVNLSTPSFLFSIGTTATLYGIKNA
jgi:pantothenate kinase